MPSNNNSSRNSLSSLSSMSFGKSKNTMACCGLVLLIVAVLTAYYYMYKSNREGFECGAKNNGPRKMSDAAIGTPPNLTPSKGECIVALFYADWCPHCVKFKPSFSKAKDTMDGKNSKGKKLRFEMVDCDAFKQLSKEYDVSGYPTIKLLKDDGTISEYSGERTYEGLEQYFVTDN